MAHLVSGPILRNRHDVSCSPLPKGSQTADFKKKFPVVSEASHDLKGLLHRKTQSPKSIPILPWADVDTPISAQVKLADNASTPALPQFDQIVNSLKAPPK